jgi:DNA end-binding protein Ku
VIVDPDALAPFVPLATETIEVEEFVNLAEIDPVYFESRYDVALTSPRSPTPGHPPFPWRHRL